MAIAAVLLSGCAEIAGVDEWRGGTGGAAGGAGAAGGDVASSSTVGSGGSAAGGGGAGGVVSVEPSLVWARSFGGSQSDTPYDVRTSALNRIGVAGRCQSGFTVDGELLLPSEDGDAGFLVLFDEEGNIPRTHLLTGDNNQRFEGIAFRGEDIFLAGVTHALADLDGEPLASLPSGGADALALAMSAEGVRLWDELWGDASSQYASSIAAGDTHVAVGGFFTGGIDVGLGTTVVSEAEDGFIARITVDDGAFASLLHVKGTGKTHANNVAMLPDQRVVAGSSYIGTFELGDDLPASDASGDGYVVGLGENGYDVDWLVGVAGSGLTGVAAVAASLDGWIVSGGRFEDTLAVVGSTVVPSAGGSDAFVMRHDAENLGLVDWTWTLSSPGGERVNDVSVGNDGSVAAGGLCVGCQALGGDGVDEDGFAVLLDATGKLVWSLHIGGAGTQLVESVALTTDGDVVVVGQFDGELDILGTKLMSAGQRDTFVARIARSR